MMPKHEMISGKWYKGISRNTYIAQWNFSKGCFIFIGWQFGMPEVMDIKHFKDVENTQEDGFIPVEEIPDVNKYIKEGIKKEVGY